MFFPLGLGRVKIVPIFRDFTKSILKLCLHKLNINYIVLKNFVLEGNLIVIKLFSVFAITPSGAQFHPINI